MFLFNLKIAFRYLLKNKTFSIIQLLGLSAGMLAALLIVQYVRFERSYDRQSPHAEQIWRVFNETMSGTQVVTQDANSHSIVAPTLQAEMPEVVNFTRLVNNGLEEATLIREGKDPFSEGRFFAVDQGFFNLFPQRFIAGNPETCLSEPWQMVLTESAAQRIFGTENPIGESLRIPGEQWSGLYTVSGIVADPPVNTHLKFNVLTSIRTRESRGHTDNWSGYWDYTYLQLAANADPEKVRRKLAELSEMHLKSDGLRLDIQPLTDIHLHSNLTYELEPNSSAQTLGLLSLTALLILLIAWMNGVNMSTARSLVRAKEVGLRKTLGAKALNLLSQFTLEALLLNGLSLLLVALLLPFALKQFAELSGKPIDHFQATADPVLWAAATAVFAGGVLLSSVLPAMSVARFKPSNVLRGQVISFGKGQLLHKGLVVFQFACSAALLIGLLVISQQVRFLRKHDLGLQLDQMLALKSPATAWNDTLAAGRVQAFVQQLEQVPGVLQTCRSSVVPALGINNISGSSAGISAVGEVASESRATVYFVDTDGQFFDTYGIPFLAGGVYLHPNQREQHQHVVINKAAIDILGFADAEAAIGRQFFFNSNPDNRYTIHGVTDNFHIETLKEPARPTIYRSFDRANLAYISLKVRPENLSMTLPAMQALWQKNFPEAIFSHTFLDQQFAAQYRSERQFGAMFGVFAILATLVACLGLFALAAHAAERRVKEIGIRKVLGATVAGITALLAKDFLKLVIIAIALAIPVAWYFMNGWLANFAYRIEIQWWMFAAAGLGAVAIAFLTVSFQSVKAALANPVKSLKNE